ncbi:MAG: isocitrate lyase/phosphoenolpyruvate mutase family protein [Pseudomonadota bacterium]
MTQAKKAETFNALHVRGDPVVLYNIWDAGGAAALAKAGAPAVATGSWSVAAAQGYGDGEAIPLDFLVRIVERITASVEVPVSVDFEGAYAAEPETAAANVTQLLNAGAIGINFEDQVVGGSGLHALDKQVNRIAAIRQAAVAAGVPLFINARTDLFLKDRDRADHKGLVAEALERGSAYAEAGASGFFVPWLADPDLIGQVCQAVPLPVNVMAAQGVPSKSDLAAVGVARISHGPGPYFDAIKTLTERYQSLS